MASTNISVIYDRANGIPSRPRQIAQIISVDTVTGGSQVQLFDGGYINLTNTLGVVGNNVYIEGDRAIGLASSLTVSNITIY